MNPAAELFANLTAELEDMHGVAVEGQAPFLMTEEGWTLLASLRNSIRRVSRLIADIALTLE